MSFSPQKSPTGPASARLLKPTINIPQKTELNKGPQSSRNASDKSMSLVRDLAEIKERRKLMESNAQLLLNRLQILAHEEKKVKRNIFEVNKRSKELFNHRVTREQQKTSEEENEKKREKVKVNEVELIRNAVVESRAKAQSEAKRIQALIQDRKRKEAEAIRLQKIQNQEKIFQAKFEHADLLKGKVQKVKEMEEFSAIKIHEYHQVKADIMKEERERLIREEEEKILQKEKELEKLGIREDALLDMLIKAETKETRAITEYEDISALPVDDLATKYSIYLKTETSTKPYHNKTMSMNYSTTNGSSVLGTSGMEHSKQGGLDSFAFKKKSKKPSHMSP